MGKARRTRLVLCALLACVAAGLVAVPQAAAYEFGERTLKQGMEGSDVRTLQRHLDDLGFDTDVDGNFGPQTKRSMERFEAEHDLAVNGICSPENADLIEREIDRLKDEEETAGDDLPQRDYASRQMEEGDRGTDVAQLQRYLSRLGLSTPDTGYFGSATRGNVKRWEAWRYKIANGRVSTSQARDIQRQARDGQRYVDREGVFPVRGPHSYGGSGSRFGAPRGDRTHQGQDVAAAHGTKLVAVHDGKVAYIQYQAGGAGHYVVIHGDDRSDSVYMHLPVRSNLNVGARVRAGEQIGQVGCTGSCTGPHLHFELWTRHWYDGGSPFDPLPRLQRWDAET